MGTSQWIITEGPAWTWRFDDKDISFDNKWLLQQIKVTSQGIKEEKHLNPYDSVYELIRQILILIKPRMNHATNF